MEPEFFAIHTFEDTFSATLSSEALEKAGIPFIIESIELNDGNVLRYGFRISVQKERVHESVEVIRPMTENPFTTKLPGKKFDQAFGQ